jgi:hypothetical protein
MKIFINKILKELELLPNYDKQISLQGVEGQIDPFYGIGKLAGLEHKESDFIYPLFPEMKYTNKVLKDLNMVRARVMKLRPFNCYSYHKDASQRMHIPLITNDKCFMIIENEVFHYPADGTAYLINTTKMHTALNAGHEDRIHIVGCIY